MLYFFLDFSWVVLVPTCVNSPGVIVKVRLILVIILIIIRFTSNTLNIYLVSSQINYTQHHIVAILYLFAPIFYPDYRWLMGTILSVELNTWFLICRRIVYRSHYCPIYPRVNPMITTAVSTLFYTTWILIRCFLYPYVLIIFLYMYKDAVESTGKYFFTETIFIFVHAALCVLNLKWTQDLFTPIVKRWFGTGPKKSLVVQSGL